MMVDYKYWLVGKFTNQAQHLLTSSEIYRYPMYYLSLYDLKFLAHMNFFLDMLTIHIRIGNRKFYDGTMTMLQTSSTSTITNPYSSSQNSQ